MKDPTLIGLFHYMVGVVALFSGTSALLSTKGSSFHQRAGGVFIASMLLLATTGLIMSIVRDILFTVFLSLLTIYYLVTGWGVATKKDFGKTVNKASPIIAIFISVAAFMGGLAAFLSSSGELDGLPPVAFYFISGVALSSCVSDVRYFGRTTQKEPLRIARHAKRMGGALLIPIVIFFFGNNHVLPNVLRNAFFLMLPVVLVVLITLFYQIKLRLIARQS